MMATPSRRRVLILAESAHPYSQSVSSIGWAHSRALAARHEVHLVTRRDNREAILDAGLIEHKEFTAIDLDDIQRPILGLAARLRGDPDKGWTLLMALSLPIYYAFERRVWRQFGSRLRAGEFDLVHRITPVSPTMPSIMASRCAKIRVHFVLGPLNGGLPWPAQFDDLRRAEREWLSYIRGVYRYVPYQNATRRHAQAILAGSIETLRQLPPRCRNKAFYLPENGIDPARFPNPKPRTRPTPKQALFVGRLVPYKGCDIAICGLKRFLMEELIHLTIIGDGPERPKLESLARELGVQDHVVFKGRISPLDVQEYYAQSDILVFPSIREFGGGVVLEAMATGVVPIVVDYGGPGEIVAERCGVKIPMGDRSAILNGVAAAVAEILAAPEKLDAMAAAGRERVDTLFTWERKAEQTSEIYEWVLGVRPDRPGFAF